MHRNTLSHHNSSAKISPIYLSLPLKNVCTQLLEVRLANFSPIIVYAIIYFHDPNPKLFVSNITFIIQSDWFLLNLFYDFQNIFVYMHYRNKLFHHNSSAKISPISPSPFPWNVRTQLLKAWLVNSCHIFPHNVIRIFIYYHEPNLKLLVSNFLFSVTDSCSIYLIIFKKFRYAPLHISLFLTPWRMVVYYI